MLLFLALLTSCNAINSATPTEILTPIVSQTSTPIAKIPLTSTHTFTPKPSATIVPTLSEIPSPTGVIGAFNTLVSPNGEFVASAYFETEHPSGIQTIEIRNKEGKLIGQIPFQGKVSASDPHELLNIFQWANDSSELYFYYVFSPDGGDRAFWWTGFDLQQFDIKTGEIQDVLPGTGFMSFAISPDGTQIAYTRSQDKPSIIYIRNLSTGSEKTDYTLFGSINYARVGDIRWSPTGEELAFQTETDDYMVQTIHLNISTMKQKVIREYKLFAIQFQGWTSDGKLEFREFKSYWDPFSQIVHVDPNNDVSVVIGTPTSLP